MARLILVPLNVLRLIPPTHQDLNKNSTVVTMTSTTETQHKIDSVHSGNILKISIAYHAMHRQKTNHRRQERRGCMLS